MPSLVPGILISINARARIDVAVVFVCCLGVCLIMLFNTFSLHALQFKCNLNWSQVLTHHQTIATIHQRQILRFRKTRIGKGGITPGVLPPLLRKNALRLIHKIETGSIL